MKASELRGKDGEALGRELTDLLKAQFGLRMQIATQQLSNSSQLKKVRRDIARVQTVMNQQKNGETTTAVAAKKTSSKKADRK